MGDDDRYENENVFKSISDKFSISLDYIYGDTIFIKDEKNVRLYKSYDLNRNFMNIGYIPHTSLFLRKNL